MSWKFSAFGNFANFEALLFEEPCQADFRQINTLHSSQNIRNGKDEEEGNALNETIQRHQGKASYSYSVV